MGILFVGRGVSELVVLARTFRFQTSRVWYLFSREFLDYTKEWQLL